MEDRSSAY